MEKVSRWILYLAAAWNVLGGVLALLDPGKHFAQMYKASLDLADPLQVFFYRCVWINVIAWGLAYALAAIWPASRRTVLVAGGAGKLFYAAACAALLGSGIAKPMVLIAAIVDTVFAAAFAAIVLRDR
ncbi:MAG TPA: hypothetical protein VJ826_12190 [Candidatus Polarisedimenticolaceae bacterium]|nr:hypothetical protein [Candidatus Polarisedimenticolaceae bacterium]